MTAKTLRMYRGGSDARRAALLNHFGVDRRDLAGTAEGERMLAKIRAAADESILTDQPCVGKHWWVMDFDDRSVCPYCDWVLTRAVSHLSRLPT